jgi:hypothetical protein
MVAGVPVHLAAAGLLDWKVNSVAEALEYANYGLAGLGKESVVVTGDEQRHSQGEILRNSECSWWEEVVQ